MNAIENILSFQLVQKLGWILLHFIWQAAAVALLLAVLLRILRRFSANLRYVTACLTLGLVVLLPVVTMQFINVSPSQKEQPEFRIPDAEIRPQTVELQSSAVSSPGSVIYEPVRQKSTRMNYFADLKQKTADVLEPALPHIVTLWLLGVFALSIWHLGGWTQLQRLRKKMVKQVDASLKTKLNRLSEKLGVNQAVELLESALVQIPTVVGWIKPVILLPAEALTGLNTVQLEAILAHELAHIKRLDYLVNMLQTVVEILGFYHPAVWWVSHKIRTERENCCDDLAVTVTGDRVRYARALTSMEEIRGRSSELAVAATGGNLFSRIRRLIGKDSSEKTFSWIPAVTAILLLVALIIPTTLALTSNSNEDPNQASIEKMLLDGFRENRDKFKCGILAWTLTDKNEGLTGGPKTETKGSFQLWWDGNKKTTRFKQEKTDLDAGVVIDRRSGGNVYDGEPLSSKPRFEVFEDWLEFIIHWTGSMSIDREIPVLKKRHNIEMNFSTVVINGTKLVKLFSKNIDESTVDYGAYKLKYFDPSKGYCLVNEEWYIADDKLRLRYTFKLQEVIPGGWFPVDVDLKAYSLKDGSVYVDRQLSLDLKRCIFNEPAAIPEGIFDLSAAKEHEQLNEILEKYSKAATADVNDENIQNVCRSVENYISAALAGEDKKAAEYAAPESAVVRQTDDTRQVFQGQPAQILAVCSSEWNALVISSVILADHGRIGPVVFHLKKEILDQKVHWLIDDIDIETLDSIETEIKRFLDRNLQAKTILFKPQRPVIAPMQSSVQTNLEKTTTESGEETNTVNPNSWQEKFNSTYSLKDGEVLKHIAPPFIPERREYLLSSKGENAVRNDRDLTTVYIFHWDGNLKGLVKFTSSVSASMPLKVLLQFALNWGSYDYDGPREVLETAFAGDWIVRKDVPVEMVLNALKDIYKDEKGKEINFTKQKIETEKIIAKGRYNFQSLPNITDGKYVLISTNKTDTYTDGGGGTGTLNEFLNWVANRIKMDIIDETESGDIKMSWRNHDSSDLRKLNDNKQRYNTQLDMLLKNLSLQTGLTFERTKTTTEKWSITEEDSDKNRQEKVSSDMQVSTEQEKPIGRRMDNIAFFTQPITRTINSTIEQKDCFIDFDNNKLFTPPADFGSLNDEQQKAWKQENGIDAISSTSEGGEGLWGEQMVVIPVANEGFPRMNPSSFRNLLQRATPANPAVMTAIGELPKTYVFKTREGGMGLLQILEVQSKQKPNCIEIRYKMIPRTNESDTKIISDRKIRDLGKVMVLYCTRHQGNLPDSMQDFATFMPDNLDIDWLNRNIAYLGKGKTEKDMPDTIIAYDRSLLLSQQGTNVLFLDGHVEFVEAEKIKGLVHEEIIENPQEQPGTVTQEPPTDVLANRVYDISDLVSVGARLSEGTVDGMTGGDGDAMGGMGSHVNIPEKAIVNEAQKIVNLMIQTIEPNSWYENNPNAKGTIFTYPAERPGKLAIYQSVQVHQKIEKFIESRREQINTTQISIEMRILHASENFPEEISEKLNLKLDSNTPLDDLQTETLLKAAQADEGTKMLVAPKVTVLDNESAQFSMHTELPLVSGYTELNNPDEKPKPIIDYKQIGTFCELKPNVTPDKRNVFLNFELEITQLTGFKERVFQDKYKEQIPQFETNTIASNKNIPDGKTLFLDGGPITIYEKKKATSAETTTDSSERTKEKKRLIILVKPTIITPEQAEQLGLERTPPNMMGGYGQGDLPPGFGAFGGSSYGTPPPEIQKQQSTGKPATRVYDITDLAETTEDVNDLIRRIKETIEPDSWYDNNDKAPGAISAFPVQQPKKLAIYQSIEVHQKIQKNLDSIRSSSGEEFIWHPEPTFPKNWEEIMRHRETNEKTRQQIASLRENLIELETQRKILQAQTLIHENNLELSRNRQETINNLPSVKALTDKLAEVEKELIEARQTYTESHPQVRQLIKLKEDMNEQLDKIKAKPLEEIIKQETINNLPSVKALTEKLAEVEKKLLTARQTLTESHPQVRQLIKLKEDLNKRLDEEKQRAAKLYDQDMNTKERRQKIDDLRASLDQIKAQTQQIRDTLKKEDPESDPQIEARQEQQIKSAETQPNEPEQIDHIMIEMNILKVSDDFLKFVGLDNKSLQSFSKWKEYLTSNTGNKATFEIDKLNADLLIKVAAARKDIEMLVSPRLIAFSGKKVNIPIPDKQYYAIKTPQKANEASQEPKTEILETGSFITFTPEYMEDRKNIQLDYDIKFYHLVEFQETKIDDKKKLVEDFDIRRYFTNPNTEQQNIIDTRRKNNSNNQQKFQDSDPW